MSHRSFIGQQAPSFTLPNYDGQNFTFTPGANGIPAVVFFYPESGSYGCTRQACQLRDAVAEKPTFNPGKVEIIGISTDPVEKQKEFVVKEKLNEAVGLYGVGKGMFGLVNTARVTFIIDKKGIGYIGCNDEYGAHSKFATNWLEKLEAEDTTTPTATSTAENPQPSS
ncbi:thioredoxin-like protein [Cyathus striatus]|nr:thioredoxin-like protein [Cyathus striatus]